MKWVLIIYSIIQILFAYAYSFAADKNYSVESLFNLPEEKIDIGIAGLILAKEIYPDIDIKAYSAKIDEMANGARILTKGSKDPDYRIRALNTFFFKIAGIKYDFSDPYGRNLKNRYINGILDRKKGNCVSMPLLYLAIAQRLGYPVYAVGAPDHLFLRYVDPNFGEQNIEVTGGGGYSSDKDYIREFQISERGIKSGTYLKTMTHRELLADLIAGVAVSLGMQGDIKRAVRFLEKCVKMSPNSAEINDSLGRAYLIYSRNLTGIDAEVDAEEYWIKGLSYKKKAKELGLVRPPAEEYIKMMKKKAKEDAMTSKGGKQ
ncbi:MAG: hypothetical protein HY035_06520 [Nitrospirae bacterium]|nr:hypothetical protein [Nitrospirota bacterium]